jgi:uncharacterized membrane protein YhaH (DUF805 family)
MSFLAAYESFWRRYLDFNGRTSRGDYWRVFAINMILNILFYFAASQSAAAATVVFLYGLASLIPGIAINVRRLHDTNRRGWWLFALAVPIAGPIFILVLMALPGNQTENRFGPPSTPRGLPQY